MPRPLGFSRQPCGVSKAQLSPPPIRQMGKRVGRRDEARPRSGSERAAGCRLLGRAPSIPCIAFCRGPIILMTTLGLFRNTLSSGDCHQIPEPVPNPQPQGPAWSPPSASWGPRASLVLKITAPFPEHSPPLPSAPRQPSPGTLTTSPGCSFIAPILQMRQLRLREKFSGATLPKVLWGQGDIPVL